MANKPDPTDLSSLLAARKQLKRDRPAPEPEKKKVGRPRSRSSDPNCAPLNLVIDIDTVDDVRYKLAKLNKGKSPKQSLSALVEELLRNWLSDN